MSATLLCMNAHAQKLVFDSTYVSTFPFNYTAVDGCFLVNDSMFLIHGVIDEPFTPSPKHIQRYSFDSFELDDSFWFSCWSLFIGINKCVFNNDSIYGCGRRLFKASAITGGCNLPFIDSLNSVYNCINDIHETESAQYYIKETGKFLGGYYWGIVPGSDSIRPGGFNLYSINNNGTYDHTFNHDTNGQTLGIYPGTDSIYLIAGTFSEYDGQPRNKLVKIDCYGNLLSGQTPFADNSYIPAVVCADPDGKIIVIGALILNDHPNDTVSIVRLNTDLSLDTTFNFMNFHYQYSIEGMSHFLRLEDGYLVSGTFDDFFGVERHSIARLTLDGDIVMDEFNHSGFDHHPNPWSQPYTNNVQRLKDYVYVSGDFDGYNGHSVSPVVRFKIVYDTLNPDIEYTDFSVYPNPSTGNFTVEFNTIKDDIYLLEIFDSSGKLIQKTQFDTNKEIVDISLLANGIYFFKHEEKVIRVVKI